MSQWKNISKIDAHIHLTPDDVIEANRDYDGKFIVNGAAGDYIKLMQKYNIDKAFLMPFNDPAMLSMEFTVEAVHNNLLKIADTYEGLFYCFADVDVRRDIVETLRAGSCFEHESFIGKLHAANTGYPIDGLYCRKFFEYAEKHNIL